MLRYFGREGASALVLLTGGTKKKQRRDIETAGFLWSEHKAGKLP